MPNDRIDQVRSWARDNEPLLRLVEVICVIAFGSILTAVVSWQQTRIANKELAVAEQQLKLAQAEVPPKIEFSGWSSTQNAIQAICHRKDVEIISCWGKLFVEQDAPGGPRRISIPDFYRQEFVSSGVAEIRSVDGGHSPALYKFMFTDDAVRRDDKAFYKSYFNKERRVYCCVTLEYKNAIGDKTYEWFIVPHEGGFTKTIDSEPKSDDIIQLSDFKKGAAIDFDGVVSKVNELLAVTKLGSLPTSQAPVPNSPAN